MSRNPNQLNSRSEPEVPTERRRVCVIGAGIAGLVAAKVLQQDGFEVVAFEKAEDLGGVWLESRTYPGVRTNTPKEAYAFSDFPYPETADDFPTGAQVRRYLASYAEAFGVRDRIRFATEVISVESPRTARGPSSEPFCVTVRSTRGEDAVETHDVDFVVVCNGLFSIPNVPSLPGADNFTGTLVHSSQLREDHLASDRHVVVVGAGKSALDCATAASKTSASCTLLFRTPHWAAPQRIFGVRYDHLMFTRAAEAFAPYYRRRGLERVLHGVASPLVAGYWRLQSWLIRRILNMPEPLVPSEPLPGDLNIGVGGAFYEAVHTGRATPLRGEVASLGPGPMVELRSGEALRADVLVFATGWQQRLPFLARERLDEIEKNGALRLYRHVLPPDEPRMGFVGYAQSFMSGLTSEIAAHWLSQHFRGELELPSPEEMNREIDRVHEWAESTLRSEWKGFFVGPHVSHYVDDLMEDMGLSKRRSGNVLREIFGRYLPSRYRSVSDERRRGRQG